MSPDLKVWKNRKASAPFSVADIFYLFVLIFYFGIVRLPAKRDYWSQQQYMPKHEICTELDMTRDKFAFLWHHFHVYEDENIEEEAIEDRTSDSDNISDDDNLQEINLERVRQDEDEEK
eukprot:1654161-Ditylum_brightwellii.AAC.2